MIKVSYVTKLFTYFLQAKTRQHTKVKRNIFGDASRRGN